jgi:hypothetical protein
MEKIKQRSGQIIGIVGVILCIAAFVRAPSFLTPDKLIVFLFFVFMVFQQARQMLLRLGPFVAVILIYESFRSIANQINTHVNYTLAPSFDRLIFGKLPVDYLQQWLWKGHTSWYDVALYIPYMLFFVLPIGLAILVWKTKDSYYWRVVGTYSLLFFCYIEPVVRVSSSVWFSLGIHDFPSVYNHLAANPVAAVPSLHSACATLFSVFIFKIYGRRWGALSLIYPLSIYFGVVYEGEHYFFDVVTGIVYAFAAYFITPYLGKILNRHYKKQISNYKRALAK